MKKPVPATTIPPQKIAEEVAKRNGQRDLGKTVQDPARGAPKRGAK
jgi:hypothetical protein